MKAYLNGIRFAVCLTFSAAVFFSGCNPEKKSRKRIESLQTSAQTQKYEIGIACMQYILKHGTDPDYAKSLVKTLLELEFYSEAIYGVESLLEKYPDDAELFYLRSMARRKQHQYDGSLDDIRRARELQPQNATLPREAEQTREEMHLWSEIQSLNHALTNSTDSFNVLLQRARHFFTLREYDAVLYDLGSVSKMRAPKDSIYYAQKVSSLYKDSGRPVETLSEMLEYFRGLE